MLLFSSTFRERVDAFHDEDVVLVQLHEIAFEERFPLLEVIAREFHPAARQERVEVVPQQFQVHRFQRLEIELAFVVQRRPVAGHEIVVQFDDLGFHAQDAELLGQAERRRRLAAGRRSGDEDDLHAFPLGEDQVRHPGVLPFLPRLAQVDELDGLPVHQFLVQRADAADAGGMAPRGILLEGRGQLALRPPGRDPGRVDVGRRLEAETLVERHQAEYLEVAGRRDQRPVEGIHLAVQAIDPAEIPAERPAEFRLVGLSLRLEERFGFLGRNLFRRERKVRIDQFPHPGAEALETFGIRLEGRTAGAPLAQLTIQAAGQGVLDHEHFAREDVAHGMLQQETQ